LELSPGQTADIALLAGSAVSVVLVIAGIGKLAAWRTSSLLGRGIGSSELLLGLGVNDRRVAIAAATAIVIVCLAYVVYAIRAEDADRCDCFGAFLPTTGRAMQRLRNVVFLGLGVVYLVSVSHGPRGESTWPVADVGLGIVVAISIIALPWAIEWWWDSMAGDRIAMQRRSS
jgi:hypothetical protein